MRRRLRWIGYATLAVSLVLIAAMLHAWGAKEVREDNGTLLVLTVAGGLWGFFAATHLFPWLGLSFIDDAVDRNNYASLFAYVGGFLALAILYAGGSIGEGPSYWENVFSAGLGTTGLLLLWFLFELGAKASRAIAEERDLATGLRLCGLVLANSLILGRAVAGDWHSVMGTMHDFLRDGWPAAVLFGFAWLMEKPTQPSQRRPCPDWKSHGLMPALIYLGFGIAWCVHLGPWEGIPR